MWAAYIPLKIRAPEQIDLIRNLQREAAKVWNAICSIHRLIYRRYHIWLDESVMKSFVAGRHSIYSQSQAIVETYFECCERTRKLLVWHRNHYWLHVAIEKPALGPEKSPGRRYRSRRSG